MWTPRGARPEEEYRYPHNLVQNYALRLHHALKRRVIVMRAVWRVHINSKSMNRGRIRPGFGDHILTSSQPPRHPTVLSVVKSTHLSGDLDNVCPRMPREAASDSTWLFGNSFKWDGDSMTLVTQPFRQGRQYMRLPVADKLKEWNGHPLAHVAEPVIADHRCGTTLSFSLSCCAVLLFFS